MVSPPCSLPLPSCCFSRGSLVKKRVLFQLIKTATQTQPSPIDWSSSLHPPPSLPLELTSTHLHRLFVYHHSALPKPITTPHSPLPPSAPRPQHATTLPATPFSPLPQNTPSPHRSTSPILTSLPAPTSPSTFITLPSSPLDIHSPQNPPHPTFTNPLPSPRRSTRLRATPSRYRTSSQAPQPSALNPTAPPPRHPD